MVEDITTIAQCKVFLKENLVDKLISVTVEKLSKYITSKVNTLKNISKCCVKENDMTEECDEKQDMLDKSTQTEKINEISLKSSNDESREACWGAMGFFENIRTLFDPDQDDENCKHLYLVSTRT